MMGKTVQFPVKCGECGRFVGADGEVEWMWTEYGPELGKATCGKCKGKEREQR